MTAAMRAARAMRPLTACALATWLLAPGALTAIAQPADDGPATARETAPIDLTGQWVAIVNEDWRWRMITPPPGDYASVPLNAEGRRVADQWDPATDGACEAFGAAALLRMPTRLRIAWEDDDVLRVETDAGQQTRRLFFDSSAAPTGRSRQGRSVARWQPAPRPSGRRPPRGGDAAAADGHLVVQTTQLLPGWLRRNGVPYSGDAVLTEHFDRFQAPNGDEWLIVTSIVDDPAYLMSRFITSSHFRREPEDRGGWNPEPCGDR